MPCQHQSQLRHLGGPDRLFGLGCHRRCVYRRLGRWLLATGVVGSTSWLTDRIVFAGSCAGGARPPWEAESKGLRREPDPPSNFPSTESMAGRLHPRPLPAARCRSGYGTDPSRSRSAYGAHMRRGVVAVVSLYMCAAVGTRVAEAAGMRRCECSASCWCRGPFLSAFRWVMPVGHR